MLSTPVENDFAVWPNVTAHALPNTIDFTPGRLPSTHPGIVETLAHAAHLRSDVDNGTYPVFFSGRLQPTVTLPMSNNCYPFLPMRFSLKSLFLLIAVFSLLLCQYCDRSRKQQLGAKLINDLGGVSFYEHEWDLSKDLPRHIPLPARGPSAIRNWLGIDYLESIVAIRLDGASVKDGDLARLLRILPRARFLDLRLAPVTSRGLDSLQCLQHLEVLNLSGTSADDDTLMTIGRLRRLRSLDVCGTNVTDAGLQHLEHLTALRRIYVERTAVSSAGLGRLRDHIPSVRPGRY